MKIETSPIVITDQGTGSAARRHLIRSNIAEAEMYLAAWNSLPMLRWLVRTGTDSTTCRRATGNERSMYLRPGGTASITLLPPIGTASTTRLPRNGTGSTTLRLLGASVNSGT